MWSNELIDSPIGVGRLGQGSVIPVIGAPNRSLIFQPFVLPLPYPLRLLAQHRLVRKVASFYQLIILDWRNRWQYSVNFPFPLDLSIRHGFQ